MHDINMKCNAEKMRGMSIQYDDETNQILALMREWEKRFPEEEVVLITLPKYDKAERERILRASVDLLLSERFDRKKPENDFSETSKNT